MKESIQNTFIANLQRSRDLTHLHLSLLTGQGQYSSIYSEDILRAAIVLLHASLEELLRSIYKYKYSCITEDQWKNICLLGLNKTGQTKITLADIIKYKEKTVESLLKESIDDYLSRKTYNNIQDIVEFCKELGINSTLIDGNKTLLIEMIERRHKIAHNADREISRDATTPDLLTIEYSRVVLYIDNLENFSRILLDNI